MIKVPAKFSAVVALACLLASNAEATENGQTSYPVGVNTVLNGILPPPGETQFYNYTLYYDAGKFAGPHGESLVPGFQLNAFIDAPRIVHTWGTTFGPFTLSSGVIIPLVHIRADTPGGSGKRNGIGDIIVEPLYIGYSNPSRSFFAYLTTEIAVPSGSYSANRVANTGRNVYALTPQLSTTWFPAPAVEVSTTTLVEISSPNSATRYHSGAVAALEYLVGYSLNSKFQLGLQGYLLKQFTDDKVNGTPIPGNGFRGKAVAVGPQLRYMWSPAAGIVFKYQREFEVQNRPQGNKFWVELCFPL
ncbi:transporter [Cupriavidus necator]|uniref:Phenol degradation protein meta n=1 Tax=Cupriavidus necator TaxID=106590 RepID=A0A367PGM1_CUPNE|nr:transporter [Cupriavidus necator]QQX86937.1 transporter [Cupriavidus necator]RCJ07041.1 phenol degradation protein meta [Cupriavidus necator]